MENPCSSNKENQILAELAPRVSIQEAFKKFQKEKFYQLKLNKYLKNVQVDRKNPEFKQNLRQKFIETAKKYIGVPYAQKYHQPGDALYGAPLFLDCCALVRQCVFDLRQDFGYTLAKWNQSYQFDLLPDEKLTEADLKPGDLIFYSATYNNPKLKPFPHKMVHVQIYLGEGKSIGARWQKGTIQVFDSYKFESKLYHDIEFHYRSIDSWLEGKFQSHCSEHKWLDERANEWLSDKFSVFADPSLDDMNLEEKEKKNIRQIMVGKGNNSKLVQEYFSNTEKYHLMSEKEQFSPHFYFKWVQSSGQIDFYSFKEGKQIVNHIPNISVISSKLELLKTLKEMELELKSKDKPQTLLMSEFIPKTYRLDVMSDEIEFLNDQTGGVWIYKPRNLNQGRGIRMIADVNEFRKEFIRSKKFYLGEFALNNLLYYKPELDPSAKQNSSSSEESKGKYSELKHDGLIQHYVRPLLLNNKKFDIRCYMFVYSNPSIVFYHSGYLRLCIEDYTENNIEDEANLMVHLTNNCFQNKHKDYKTKKDSTISDWSLIQEHIGPEKASQLSHQIKRILLTTYAAAKRKLIAKKGTYELLGCDVIVDENCKPYLLEVNTNPAMFTDTKTQKQMLPLLTKNTLDVALGLFETQDVEFYADNCDKFGFELLYCEKTGFYYNLENENKIELKTEENATTYEVNGLTLNPRKNVCQELNTNKLEQQ